MSVQNAGAVIKAARLKSGLSQAQLADGICSTLSLSRIEQGKFGVSPSTFQALMAHMGVPCEAYPAFASRTDFNCFYTLKRSAFYLDSWQLTLACKELDSVEQMNWAENKYYYQEWLCLQSRLQFRSGSGDHELIYEYVIAAIHISRPDFNQSEIRTMLLSITEIELLIQLAQELLYLDRIDECLEVCQQISTYLANSQLSFLEKDRLSAENAIVYAKYLIATEDYETAFKEADTNRHKMVVDRNDSPLHELTYLTALASYYKNDLDLANELFQTAFYSAHSIESCYATICLHYSREHLSLEYSDYLLSLPEIPLPVFQAKKIIDTTSFGDGTYDIFSPDALSLGGLIKELRTEQKISQITLCQGICSKSKLSKIENNTQDMDIILAETLLQRLGIYDRVFTFYGNEKDNLLNDYLSRITLSRIADTNLVVSILDSMDNLITANDLLYKQIVLLHRGIHEHDDSRARNLFLDAINLTIPNFDITNLFQYQLSWTELNILNAYARFTSKNISASTGINYYYKILEYLDHSNYDILEKKRFTSTTLSFLVFFLYTNDRYSEIIELSKYFASPETKSSLLFIGNMHSHYAPSLAENMMISQAVLYAKYSYYNQLIINSRDSAKQFYLTMQTNYDITL